METSNIDNIESQTITAVKRSSWTMKKTIFVVLTTVLLLGCVGLLVYTFTEDDEAEKTAVKKSSSEKEKAQNGSNADNAGDKANIRSGQKTSNSGNGSSSNKAGDNKAPKNATGKGPNSGSNEVKPSVNKNNQEDGNPLNNETPKSDLVEDNNPFKPTSRFYFNLAEKPCSIASVNSKGEDYKVEFETEDYEISKFTFALTRAVATFMSNGKIHSFNLDSSKIVASSAENYACSKLKISPDGKLIACGIKSSDSLTGILYIFKSENMELLRNLEDPSISPIIAFDFEFSWDGKSVYFINPIFDMENCNSTRLDELELETLNTKEIFNNLPNYTMKACMSSDGNSVIVASDGNTPFIKQIYSDRENKPPRDIVMDGGVGLNLLVWSSDGKSVFTAKHEYAENCSSLRIASIDGGILTPVLNSEGARVNIRRTHMD